jgi:hypothetical protein
MQTLELERMKSNVQRAEAAALPVRPLSARPSQFKRELLLKRHTVLLVGGVTIRLFAVPKIRQLPSHQSWNPGRHG